MTLHNELPADSTCGVQAAAPTFRIASTAPTCTPTASGSVRAGNSDNVLISVNPGVQFQYEYNIPPDHPVGHLLVSLAPARLDGAAGSQRHGRRADRARHASADAVGNGDIDTLLRPISGQAVPERVLVFQQIQYACRNPDGSIKRNPDIRYKCDPGETGGVEDYDQFGPGTWPTSGRFTSINGAVLGRLQGAEAGKVERWRMIHGGVRDRIALQFRKRAPAAPEPSRPAQPPTAQAFVDTNCTGAPVPYHLIAADGLTMAAGHADPGRGPPARLSLGRAGRVSRAGRLLRPRQCLDRGRQHQPNLRPTQLLGTVRVGGTAVTPVDRHGLSQDPAAGRRCGEHAADVRAKVTAEITDGMKLTSFIPHPDINEFTGTQTLHLLHRTSRKINEVFFEIDGQPYDGNRHRPAPEAGRRRRMDAEIAFRQPSVPHPRQSVPDRQDHRS